MAEWLYEEGIGENRAILVEDDRIIEAVIELPEELRAGSIMAARIIDVLVPARRAIAALEDGSEIMVEPLPRGLGQGVRVHVEILREAIAEPGRPKLAKGRITDAELSLAPNLLERLRASGSDVRMLGPHDPDLFERAGWSELLDEAQTGEIGFAGGALRMSLTPAMTLFDVDGALDPAPLAIAGAHAAAQAVRRFGIGGSIGIDLPTVGSKEDRLKAAEAVDRVLPLPFERTAVNGFGFLQIVRRRSRASIPEQLRADPAGAAARALLRLAERTPGHGTRTLIAAPSVIALIEQQPDWQEALRRRIGTSLALQAEAGLAISVGHVHAQFA